MPNAGAQRKLFDQTYQGKLRASSGEGQFTPRIVAGGHGPGLADDLVAEFGDKATDVAEIAIGVDTAH